MVTAWQQGAKHSKNDGSEEDEAVLGGHLCFKPAILQRGDMDMNPVSDNQWDEFEDLIAINLDNSFRQWTGQAYDLKQLEDSSLAVVEKANELAQENRDDPWFSSPLREIIEYSEISPILAKLQDTRRKYLTFSDMLLNGEPLSPEGRLKYLYQEDDPKKRSLLLTRLAAGHPECDEVEERIRNVKRNIADDWGRSPIQDFQEIEGFTGDDLRNMLTELGVSMRASFEERFSISRTQILAGKTGDEWEDFVTLFFNRWSEKVNEQVLEINPVEKIRTTLTDMGFGMGDIYLDLVDRPKKVLGASAWDVRIPYDVRVTIKPQGQVSDLAILLHEMGHAMHFITIDSSLPFHIRVPGPFGIAETFSHWLQSLLTYPEYVKTHLNLSDSIAQEIIEVQLFEMSALSTWSTAQSLCLLDDWEEGPFTLSQIGLRLSEYASRFMGIEFPPGAIRVLPSFVRTLNLNVLGYPIALVRVCHLLNQLESHQIDWWESASPVEIVKDYMRRGRKAEFPTVMLDVQPLLERFGV